MRQWRLGRGHQRIPEPEGNTNLQQWEGLPMDEKNVGALPVVDNGTLVGIVSERDYTRKVILKADPPRKLKYVI